MPRLRKPQWLLLLHDLTRRAELDTAWGGPFNGQRRRQQIVEWLVGRLGVRRVVETGTYRGTTTAWFAGALGLPTDSVEANWRLHWYDRVRFRRESRVHLHHGDSRVFLRGLAGVSDLQAPTLFYLDAHWHDDLPLRDELEIVTGHWANAVVVIDDFAIPGDDGYGFDDYGPGRRIGPELLPPMPGFDVYLPTVPSAEETGARRGWAVVAPVTARDVLAECAALARLETAGIATSAAGAVPVAGRVLLVERNADRVEGHHAVAFAWMADALRELGCDVDVLTRRGWTLAADRTSPPLRIHRYGRVATAADRMAARLHRVRPRTFGAYLVRNAQTVVLVATARRLRRRLGAGEVVVCTWSAPVPAALVAGPGRWLCLAHTQPEVVSAGGRPSVSRVLEAAARRAEARRRRHGGRLRIGASTEAALRNWARECPWLDPVVVPFAMVAGREPVPDARTRLGLPTDGRLALFFGAVHSGKDADTVWRAFRDLPGWRLVVAGGGAADSYRAWSGAHDGTGSTPPVLIDGFVDEATKEALYDAVDVTVLSFRTGSIDDSGTLTDAIAAGHPVVCSDHCVTADVVRDHGLGEVFAPGDPAALTSALQRVGTAPDPVGLARVREERSARAVVVNALTALREPAQPLR